MAGVVMLREAHTFTRDLYLRWSALAIAVRYARVLGRLAFDLDRHRSVALRAALRIARRAAIRLSWSRLVALTPRPHSKSCQFDDVAAAIAASSARDLIKPILPLAQDSLNRFIVGARKTDTLTAKAPPATVFGRAGRPCAHKYSPQMRPAPRTTAKARAPAHSAARQSTPRPKIPASFSHELGHPISASQPPPARPNFERVATKLQLALDAAHGALNE